MKNIVYNGRFSSGGRFFGWWIQFHENKVDLWIGEDLLMDGRMFTGLGQCQGHVLKIVSCSSKRKHFFILIEAEHSELGMKFKLKKENMMAPIFYGALEVDPKIPGLARTTKWWKILMEKDSVVAERRYNVVKASAALMRDKPEDGAALLHWFKQKHVLDTQQPTVVDVTSTGTNRVEHDPIPEDPLPSLWHDCFAMPPDDSTFGAPRSRTKSTYEHNLIKLVLHIEKGDIFNDSDDEIIRVEHDVLDEDYEESLYVAHKVTTESSLKHPIMADVEDGFILGWDRTFDVRMDQMNDETTSSLTNMRVLDHVNAKVVYDLLRGPQRGIVSPLTLRPMAYYEAESDRNIWFEEARARMKFMEVWEKWLVGTTREEKLEDFLKNILWDTIDGQHIAYACKVFAKDDVKKGKLDTESMKSIFAKRPALVVVYDDPSLYLEASKKQRNFFKPNDAFNNILNIGKGFDEGFLHVDAEKERQWKKYEEEKHRNLNVVPPKRGEMTMN